MRLLFDENLSFRLPMALGDVYPNSLHVREVGLKGAADGRIWAYASERGLLVVSKDADFFQRSVTYGAPPKVVWLRTGNAPTAAVEGLLRERLPVVRAFDADAEATFLALGSG